MPLNFRNPWIVLATWFGCGLMKPAPGTWGTLGALPFGILILVLGGWPVLLLCAVAVTVVGVKAADVFMRESGAHDHPAIVVDEVAGMWVTLLAAVATPLSIVLAFGLFRFFDVLKPWPVGWLDRHIKGGRGVMADDIAAGIMAALTLGGLRLAGIG